MYVVYAVKWLFPSSFFDVQSRMAGMEGRMKWGGEGEDGERDIDDQIKSVQLLLHQTRYDQTAIQLTTVNKNKCSDRSVVV